MTLFDNKPLEEHEVLMNLAARPCVDCRHPLADHMHGQRSGRCSAPSCDCPRYRDQTEAK